MEKKTYCIWLEEYANDKKIVKVCKPFYGLPHIDKEFHAYYKGDEFDSWSKHLGRDFTAEEVLEIIKQYQSEGYSIKIHSL